jgi:hypothetical protein
MAEPRVGDDLIGPITVSASGAAVAIAFEGMGGLFINTEHSIVI